MPLDSLDNVLYVRYSVYRLMDRVAALKTLLLCKRQSLQDLEDLYQSECFDNDDDGDDDSENNSDIENSTVDECGEDDMAEDTTWSIVKPEKTQTMRMKAFPRIFTLCLALHGRYKKVLVLKNRDLCQNISYFLWRTKTIGWLCKLHKGTVKRTYTN